MSLSVTLWADLAGRLITVRRDTWSGQFAGSFYFTTKPTTNSMTRRDAIKRDGKTEGKSHQNHLLPLSQPFRATRHNCTSVSIDYFFYLLWCTCCRPLLEMPESIDMDKFSESRALPPNLAIALFPPPPPPALPVSGLWNSSTMRISCTNCCGVERCWRLPLGWFCLRCCCCWWWWLIVVVVALLWFIVPISCGGVLNVRWNCTDSATVDAKEGL